jgi:hypothetical protein
VKSNGSLNYFIPLSYKNYKKIKKYISFLYFLPLAPDPDSECGSGSTKVIESESNPEPDQLATSAESG